MIIVKKMTILIFLIASLFISAKAAEGDYIIKFKGDAPVMFMYDDSEDLGAGLRLVPASQANYLNKAGLLEICEPDCEMTLYDTPNDTQYADQWNLPIIKAEAAWSFKTFGNDVLVGIVDSGLCENHPDIDYSRVVEGYNFAASKDDQDYATEIYNTTDTVGHGTKVSGTIIASMNNSEGLAGIADKVKLIPLKCADKTGAIWKSAVINAINAGAGYFGCDVINISIGDGIQSDALDYYINYAQNLGCIVVAAVGNNTTADPGNHLRYPAACSGVIGVGSTTIANTRATSSVVNESVDVCAPAASIPLLSHLGGYTTGGGTSFAAPQVAAAAAIAKSIDPYITPAEFAELLQKTVTKPTANKDITYRDNDFGYGILNIENMVNELLKNRTVYVSPFDESTSSVTIFNLTGNPISATSIFALYSYVNDNMSAYDPENITIPANDHVERFFGINKYGRLKHFLWTSLYSAMPFDNYQYFREMQKN